KTLNLSMLKYFYDCCPDENAPPAGDIKAGQKKTHSPGTTVPGDSHKRLFDSLAISKAGKVYQDKMGNHPVVFLSFRCIKERDWGTCMSKIKGLIQTEYLAHDYLLESPAIKTVEKKYVKKIINLEGDDGDYESSLEKLLIFLSRHYGKRVVILIDEYDAPIHAGFSNNYYEDVVAFMRNFLCGALKDTGTYLEKSVLTGIMRIAKESIFSGLNNLGVYTLTREEFDGQFGFTEEEVKTLLKDFSLLQKYDDVQKWYNGYRFGARTIYNPWSLINLLESKEKLFTAYWVNTSHNQIVESLLSKGGKELKKELEVLLRGDSMEKAIEENIVLKEVAGDDDVLWGFLLMGGYLKQTARRSDDASGRIFYTLSIPNREVRTIYTRIVRRYFSTKVENENLAFMLDALRKGDVPLFGKMLKKVVLGVFSYHDFGDESEKVYHALVAGLLTWMSGTHEIKSNRESGYGRYDIMIIPRDPVLTGYVIEFKKVDKDDGETVETALAAALTQIEEKKYETELIERGIKAIRKLAIAFNGKEVHVKEKGSK
ncbi:MAG: AAA family ATPase, partial [bacterium]|nr:AAA family ATPase [bacterium]